MDGTLYRLTHITDLHQIEDQHIEVLQRAIPELVQSLRVMHAEASALGQTLDQCMPAVMFDPSRSCDESTKVPVDPGVPAAPASYRISRMTDLVGLEDEHIEAFCKDIPSVVSTMRILHRECLRTGDQTHEILPHITFESGLGPWLIVNTSQGDRAFSATRVIATDLMQTAISKAKGPRC